MSIWPGPYTALRDFGPADDVFGSRPVVLRSRTRFPLRPRNPTSASLMSTRPGSRDTGDPGAPERGDNAARLTKRRPRTLDGGIAIIARRALFMLIKLPHARSNTVGSARD